METHKKALCVILALLLTLGLCACSGETAGNNNDIHLDSELPEAIFGTWWPHPEVSDAPIEISSDGTCTIDGQTLEWTVDTTDVASATLIAGEYHLHFNHLPTSLPLLSATNLGTAVKEPEIWNYLTEWHSEETGNVFALDLEELAQSGCNITFDDGVMTVEVLTNDEITHTIQFFDTQATVTFADGSTAVYYSPEGGSSDIHPGDTDDDPATLYQQAVEDLQNVLAGGYMVDYVDSDGASHIIYGSRAIEKLYHTFVSLQNYMDVSEYLSHIQRVDNVLVTTYSSSNGLDRVPSKEKYNAYGQRLGISFEEAINTGNYLYYGHDETGTMAQVTIMGLIAGAPVVDANGRITALIVTSPSTGNEYTAPITYDTQGRIVRVDLPCQPMIAVDEVETDFNEIYEFLYDENSRLLQYSRTWQSHNGTYEHTEAYKRLDCYDKNIVECYYNSAGKIEQTRTHHFDVGTTGESGWHYSTTSYSYNSAGNLQKSRQEWVGVQFNIIGVITSQEEYDRMDSIYNGIFLGNDFKNSIGEDFLGSINGHYYDMRTWWEEESEYGSIYIYNEDQ